MVKLAQKVIVIVSISVTLVSCGSFGSGRNDTIGSINKRVKVKEDLPVAFFDRRFCNSF